MVYNPDVDGRMGRVVSKLVTTVQYIRRPLPVLLTHTTTHHMLGRRSYSGQGDTFPLLFEAGAGIMYFVPPTFTGDN